MRIGPALLLGVGLLLAAPVRAQPPGAPGGFSVSPIRVDLAPGERGRAVTLSNRSGERRTIQVEIYAWSQAGDEEQYLPTRELLANPPLFFLEAGASQVVRIGRSASAATVPGETAFRVYFREVLDAATPSHPALRIALRLGIPVFLAPATATAPQLSWSGVVQRDGSVTVRVRNSGGLHARVADLRLLGAQGAAVLGRGELFQYVLPGATRSWRIAPTVRPRAGPARVAVLLEEGAREFPLELRPE